MSRSRRELVVSATACLALILTCSAANADAVSSAAAPALVEKFVAALNRHDLDGALSVVADNFREVFSDGNTITSRMSLRDHLALEFFTAPRVTFVLQDLVGNDTVADAQVSILPDPRVRAIAPEYSYVFRVASGKITQIEVFDRSVDAQRAAALPAPAPSPTPSGRPRSMR